MAAVFAFKDDQAVELFRLRYALREAAERRTDAASARRALDRFRDLARRAGRGELLFEYRRWCVQLGEMAEVRAA